MTTIITALGIWWLLSLLAWVVMYSIERHEPREMATKPKETTP